MVIIMKKVIKLPKKGRLIVVTDIHGNKEDYEMHSMDFEEFLWAKGYKKQQIEDLYTCMKEVKPLTETQYTVMMNHFNDYIITSKNYFTLLINHKIIN